MIFFDAHTHIGSDQKSLLTIEEMIAAEKQAGISGALFSPISGVCSKSESELDSGNKEALELWTRYPDFLYPGVSVHPNFQQCSLYWLDAFRERGLIWCGEWLSYICNVPFDHQSWRPFFEYAHKNNMILQLHNAPEVALIAKHYPELTVIGSHLNPDVLPLLEDCPNVYVDISGMHGGLIMKTLPRALALFGADRLLFGTDMPIYDPEPFVMRSRRDFHPAELEKIASANLLKILRNHGVQHVFGHDLQHDSY